MEPSIVPGGAARPASHRVGAVTLRPSGTAAAPDQHREGNDVTSKAAEPAFTVGIEEEYKVVDLATGDLVRDLPDGMMDRIAEAVEGQVGPEFMRSQIEVASPVCGDLVELRAQLAKLAPGGRHRGQPPRPGADLGEHPSVGGLDRPDQHRQGALQRPCRGHGRCRPAPAHLRHARPRRRRGRGAADRPDEPGVLLHAPPAGDQHVVTVLARHRDRAQELPHLGVPGRAPHRPPRRVHLVVRLPPPCRHPRRGGGHRGCHPAVVGPPALRPLPDARDAGLGHLHQHRRRHDGRRHVPLPAAHAVPASQVQPAVAHLLPDAAQREHVAGAAVRHLRWPDRLRSGHHHPLRRPVRGDPRARRRGCGRGRDASPSSSTGGRSCPAAPAPTASSPSTTMPSTPAPSRPRRCVSSSTSWSKETVADL